MLRHTLQQSERSTGTEKKKKPGCVFCSVGVTYGVEEAAGNRKQEVIICSDGLWCQPDDRVFACDEPGKPGQTQVTPGNAFAAG